MENPHKYKYSQIWKILLILGILLALPISMPHAQNVGLMQGLQYYDNSFSTSIGFTWRKSPRVSIFASGQSTPESAGLAIDGAIWFPITAKLDAGALVGPEIESISDNPTDMELLTYLKAATGTALRYKFSPTFEACISANYYLIDHDRQKWRYSFTVSVYL